MASSTSTISNREERTVWLLAKFFAGESRVTEEQMDLRSVREGAFQRIKVPLT